MESDFFPFFHFLQKFLSMESSKLRTNPTDQSYSKECPQIFFFVPREAGRRSRPRSNNWRRLQSHSSSPWLKSYSSSPWLKPHSFSKNFLDQRNGKRNSQGCKQSKKSSNLSTSHNSLISECLFYLFLLCGGKFAN